MVVFLTQKCTPTGGSVSLGAFQDLHVLAEPLWEYWISWYKGYLSHILYLHALKGPQYIFGIIFGMPFLRVPSECTILCIQYIFGIIFACPYWPTLTDPLLTTVETHLYIFGIVLCIHYIFSCICCVYLCLLLMWTR